MFDFAKDFDVSFETLKTSLATINVMNETKYENGYNWPIFKTWFAARLMTTIDATEIDVVEFLKETTFNRSPPRFSTLIAAFIKAKFSEKFLHDYDDEFDGINLFAALNRDFHILANFDRIKLLKNFMFNIKSIVKNPTAFKNQMLIINHYFPETIKLSSSISLFALSDPEIGRYLRSMNIHGKSERNIESLINVPYSSVLREIKELRKEGIIPATTETSDDKFDNTLLAESLEEEESFIVMANVRCFSCKKWGHFSRNCPLKKRKFQEVQLVEVPLDAEVIITDAKAKEELYLIEQENLENGMTENSTEVVKCSAPVSGEIAFGEKLNSTVRLVDKLTTLNVKDECLLDLSMKGNLTGNSYLPEFDRKGNSFIIDKHEYTTNGNFALPDYLLSKLLERNLVLGNCNLPLLTGPINKDECCTEEIYLLNENNNVEFVVDSGATIHVTNDKSLLSNSRNGLTLIKGVNGSTTATIEGEIEMGKLCLQKVQFIEHAPRNIISVHRLTLEGYDVQIDHEKLTIKKNNQLICFCSRNNNLWMLTPKDVIHQMVFIAEDINQPMNILQQHINHGHASKKQLKSILGKYYSDSAVSKALKECQTCASVVPKTMLRKQHEREFDVGEMICADLIGPINESYGLVISDRKSKFAVARVLRTKSEVSTKTLEILKTFKNLLSLTKKNLVMFRADNEFDTRLIKSFCDEEGITTQFTAPHSSYQNGFAESQNREIERKLKLMLIDSNIPKTYWNFAFHHSVFINNYVPRNMNTQSAWELFRDCKKLVQNVLPFGCRIYAFNHDTKQKIFKKDIKGTFLGYHQSTRIAFVLEDTSGRIIRSSSFTGIDCVFPLKLDSMVESNTTQSLGGGSNSLPEPSEPNKSSAPNPQDISINGDDDTIMKEDFVEEVSDSDVELTSGSTTDAETPQFNTTITTSDGIPSLRINDHRPTKMIVQRSKDSDLLILKPVVTPVSRIGRPKPKRRRSFSPDPLNLLLPSTSSKQLRLTMGDKPSVPIDQATSSKTDQIEDANMSSRKMLEYSLSDSSDEGEVHLLVDKNKYLIPTTFKEAILTPQKAQWLAACSEELMAMKHSNVYDVVPNAEFQDKIVRGRWVFAVKNEPNGERFKARLVAKGFSQIKGENFVDVYAPVMSFDTLRFILAIASINHWKIEQLDAKNAFLNGPIDYDVYFQPPEGCNVPKGFCWKLKRGLYGLKQAPKIWFNTITSVLRRGGYTQSILEPCLFYKPDLFLVVYVDDILVTGITENVINHTKRILKEKFVMKDLGHPDVFLGITVKKTSNGVRISLSDFISKMQKDYEISKEKVLATPLVKGFNAAETASRTLTEEEHLKYRSIIGSLLFVANTVRLDISFATSLLSRYLVNPRMLHLKAAYRVLQYIVQTKEFFIEYSPNGQTVHFKDFRYLDKTKDVKIDDYGKQSEFFLTVLSDSDFAADLKDRKSQSGSCTFLNNNLISWSSRKQTCVSLSSTESEYVALAESAKSGLYFNNLLKEINLTTSYVNLCGDNLSALTLSAHKAVHQKTKHIDVKYHFLRSMVDNKDMKLNYVNTKFNIADILTKTVDTTTFSTILNLISPKSNATVTKNQI